MHGTYRLMVGAGVCAVLLATGILGALPRRAAPQRQVDSEDRPVAAHIDAKASGASGSGSAHSHASHNGLPPLRDKVPQERITEVYHYDLQFLATGKRVLSVWRVPGQALTIKDPSDSLVETVREAVSNRAKHIVFAYEADGNVGIRVINRTGNRVLDSLNGAEDPRGHFAWTKEKLKAAEKDQAAVRPNLKNLLKPERQEEWRRYLAAFQQMTDNGVVGDFVSIHWKYMHRIHHVKRFLHWHRLMLYEFEQRLQQYDPSVTIPYWDFAEDPAIPAQFATWKPAVTFSDPDSGQAVHHQVVRNGSLDDHPTPDQVKNIVDHSDTFNSFWNTWESSQNIATHDLMHGYIGDTMSQQWKAVADPIFWVFHANVDRVWDMWQAAHPNDYPPISGALEPWTLTSDDVRDIKNQLKYVYEQ
jgi:hypothetical protein